MLLKAKNRVALYLQDKHPLRDAIEYVKYAEERGFEAVWQAESRLVRDAITPLAAFGATSERIKLGSGVINNWTRNVGLIAATFVTLDDLAPGRVMCGIGAWWEPLASKVGVERRRPLRAMREVVTVLRRLFRMETVSYQGEFVKVREIDIDIVHGDRSPRNIPIYIGATGLKMMELAGEVADGVLLNYCVPPEYNDLALKHLEIGAGRARRSLDDIDRPQLIVCSVDRDHQRAIENSTELLTQYLAQQPHIAKASGVQQEAVEKIQGILGWPATHEQVRRAMKFVPEGLVEHITASGTPEECRAKVREYLDKGCTCPILYPLGDDVRLMIDTFANGF